jgi:DNA-binding CsgD family transcriptional regulator
MNLEHAHRVRRAIVRLCQAGLDSTALGLAAERLLRGVIPFDRACWHNVDPASGMLTSVIGEAPPTDPLLPLLEYGTVDVNQYVALAHATAQAAGLRWTTGDEPIRSRRYREILRPLGIDDELTAAFVIDGLCWGCARLYRSRGWPHFDAVEVAFVLSLCPALAQGFRAAVLAPGLGIHEVPDGPGVLVLDDGGRTESMTPSAQRWLDEIIDVVPGDGGPLPVPVYAVAARARSIAVGDATNPQLARCRVPTRSGRWLLLHGARLLGGAEGRTAVIIEPAPATELAPLIVRAYGLTEREREVAQSALHGLATKQIARALGLSPYTVSDHLRVVFEKVGVSSRTELAARIFFEQYAPRLGQGDPVGTDGWFVNSANAGTTDAGQ